MKRRNIFRAGHERFTSAFFAGLIGISIGFAAGRICERLRTTRDPQSVESGRALPAGKVEPDELIAKYRVEVARLNQSRERDIKSSKEKELLLEEFERRGVKDASPTMGRLKRERDELVEAVADADGRLRGLRQQLSELMFIENTSGRGAYELELERSEEINARRIVLEHDAGLGPD